MPKALLSDSNPCGQTLLKLVARGNAIVAELFRLADFVPPVFRLDSKHDQLRFGSLISDFSYFKTSETFEAKIDADQRLQDVDDELRENNIDILTRFYLVFESVHKYVMEINRFVSDLEDDFYIQQTVETALQDPDGKQLMTEMVYLYGVMLLVIDQRIDGVIRERILVSYYRYSAQSSTSETNIEDVCRLLRSTSGLTTRDKKSQPPPNYPEAYFARISIKQSFIELLIGCLRSDDIYCQLPVFPSPDHRSAALSQQSAMLFICLFFAPDILMSRTSIMREIVDKYFPDNWIISVYMGITFCLADAWDSYKAAKAALQNSLELSNIRSIASKYGEECMRLTNGLDQVLLEGVLSPDYVLDKLNKLMNTLRKCNVVLRWLMLHTAGPLETESDGQKKWKQLRELAAVEAKVTSAQIFKLLLNTAQFESQLKEILKRMLQDREGKWTSLRDDSAGRMKELSEVFSGSAPLSRIVKNEKLQQWFNDTSVLIEQLSLDNPNSTAKKIIKLIHALEEVQEFHNLETHLQIRQYLEETRQQLHQMLRTLNLQDDCLANVEIIADFSYGWIIIEGYTRQMQDGMKKDPFLGIKLRSVFLKLTSTLNIPLLRIQQSDSQDLISVSQYYSTEVVQYVRQVLQVIPETVFSLLSTIINIQTTKIKELPTRLEKDKVKEYMQLNERFEVAELTHKISVLTEGILSMKTTLVGIIKVDPKQLLEDGIRKELVKLLAKATNSIIKFPPVTSKNKGLSELQPKLTVLAGQMDGFHRSFEYISDYINMCGLKIWQEELSRLINYYVEQECNMFARQKAKWDSVYQSKTIPIPIYPSSDAHSKTFIGRLSQEMMRVADPRTTVYIHYNGTWYDQKTRKECLNPQIWKLLLSSLSNLGVAGIDRLFCFKTRRYLERISSAFKLDFVNSPNPELPTLLLSVEESFEHGAALIAQPARTYAAIFSKLQKSIAPCVETILKIGELCLFRLHIVGQLNSACKFESKLLENALQTFNRSLMTDVFKHYKDHSHPYPKEDSPLFYEITNYLDAAGITNPLLKIYMKWPHLEKFALFFALSILSQLSKLHHCDNIGLLSRRPQDAIDGTPFVVGAIVVATQIPVASRVAFYKYIAQFAKSLLHISHDPNNRALEYPTDVLTLLSFISLFIQFFPASKQTFHSLLPSYVHEQLNQPVIHARN